eukprot:7463066-Pyramimonas_sp.AAC.2
MAGEDMQSLYKHGTQSGRGSRGGLEGVWRGSRGGLEACGSWRVRTCKAYTKYGTQSGRGLEGVTIIDFSVLSVISENMWSYLALGKLPVDCR